MDTGRIAHLLRQIVAYGQLDQSNPRSCDDSGGHWPSFDKNVPENNYDLLITPDACEDLVSIMRELRTDQRIAMHVEYEALESEVIKATAKASAAFAQGALDEEAIATEVVAHLTQDVRDWHVVVHVPGLTVAEGVSINVAGIEMGWLPPEEYQRLVHLGQDRGSTMRLQADMEIGSAAEYCKQLAQDLLSQGKGAWAWGSVSATKKTLDRTAYEHVYEVALNILRCFISRFREDPERVSLGEPEHRDVDKRLAYVRDDPISTLSMQHSRFSDRRPFSLSQDKVTYLNADAAWNRAQEICVAAERTDLEDAMYRAMLQFGTTTTIAPLGVRLAGYLTALEAILLGDDDYSHHVTYIARRLSALTGYDEFDNITYLYGARQGPVHRAERNLAGNVVVLAEEVNKLRLTVHQALMAILDPPTELNLPADLHRRRELHAHLDAIIKADDATRPQHAFLVRASEDGQDFEATSIDFPNCVGVGASEAIAQDRARVAANADVRRLIESGEAVPTPTNVKLNRLPVQVPTDSADVEAYLASVKNIEDGQKQKFRHIKGGVVDAVQAAGLGGVSVSELEGKRKRGVLVGFPTTDKAFEYPVWQFQKGRVVPELEQALTVLGTLNPWAQAAFMLNFNCGESRPIEELRGGNVARVLEEARRVRRQNGAWLPLIRPRPTRAPEAETGTEQVHTSD